MSDCVHCSSDANNFCEWCGAPYCDDCTGEHDGCRAPVDKGDTNSITDPIITPFVKRHLAAGYTIKKRPGGCDDLSVCPRNGQHRYCYTFIKDGVETQKCPDCDPKA